MSEIHSWGIESKQDSRWCHKEAMFMEHGSHAHSEPFPQTHSLRPFLWRVPWADRLVVRAHLPAPLVAILSVVGVGVLLKASGGRCGGRKKRKIQRLEDTCEALQPKAGCCLAYDSGIPNVTKGSRDGLPLNHNPTAMRSVRCRMTFSTSSGLGSSRSF